MLSIAQSCVNNPGKSKILRSVSCEQRINSTDSTSIFGAWKIGQKGAFDVMATMRRSEARQEKSEFGLLEFLEKSKRPHVYAAFGIQPTLPVPTSVTANEFNSWRPRPDSSLRSLS